MTDPKLWTTTEIENAHPNTYFISVLTQSQAVFCQACATWCDSETLAVAEPESGWYCENCGRVEQTADEVQEEQVEAIQAVANYTGHTDVHGYSDRSEELLTRADRACRAAHVELPFWDDTFTQWAKRYAKRLWEQRLAVAKAIGDPQEIATFEKALQDADVRAVVEGR